ncbi:MAG: hypothetical protein UZ22_OP11002000397 [Microgenomates bacterium OLB23]|nr:MAG: hypothetical protein UZ22_OP11002000397 [Microgenomates bacterium OLB23]
MSDTLREIAQEAVARAESSTVPVRKEHAKKVAATLRAEADEDVFTGLEIAAGEQVSIDILRANLDVSIGILRDNGSIDRLLGATPPSGYETRFNRASTILDAVKEYFDDQKSFAEFKATTEGQQVIKQTGKFLSTHPALAEYFVAIIDPRQRVNAAKALAEQYLQDPFAREKIKQALLESAINKGEVADEYSEVARKRDALAAKVAKLEAELKKLEGDATAHPPVVGEVDVLKARRREFDRNIDPSKKTAVEGKEFKAIQDKKKEMASIDGEILIIDGKLKFLQEEVSFFDAEMRDAKRKGFKGTRSEADIIKDINGRKLLIESELKNKSGKLVDKSVRQAAIDAIEADQKRLDDEIKQKLEDLKQAKEALSSARSEQGEQILMLKKLEAAKGRAEEIAVSELENIFKKGVEQELMERLDKAKAAADKALEESAAKAKDIDEKQYRELRAKRHKTVEGKIDGVAINEDFTDMMRPSAEYYIVKNDDNTVHISRKDDATGVWFAVTSGTTPPAATPPGSDTYYLTGPEVAIINMMNRTREFGSDYMLGKLKDAGWLQAEGQSLAAQTLQDKMYASRGWLQRRRTGVRRLTTNEIIKIKNSTWGQGILEQALETNKQHIKELDDLLKSDVLKGPGSWREKIGRLSNKQLALLILGLSAGGVFMASAAAGTMLSGLTTAAINVPTASYAGALGGAAVGAGVAGAGRSRRA